MDKGCVRFILQNHAERAQQQSARTTFFSVFFREIFPAIEILFWTLREDEHLQNRRGIAKESRKKRIKKPTMTFFPATIDPWAAYGNLMTAIDHFLNLSQPCIDRYKSLWKPITALWAVIDLYILKLCRNTGRIFFFKGTYTDLSSTMLYPFLTLE